MAQLTIIMIQIKHAEKTKFLWPCPGSKMRSRSKWKVCCTSTMIVQLIGTKCVQICEAVWAESRTQSTTHLKQGNSVTRDLPQTGSETNTTIFVIYIYIGYRFPLSLSTIWGNHLPVNFMLKFPTCISTIWRNHLPHLTSKWRGTFQYFQSHDKIPYIYYLEKPPPI